MPREAACRSRSRIVGASSRNIRTNRLFQPVRGLFEAAQGAEFIPVLVPGHSLQHQTLDLPVNAVRGSGFRFFAGGSGLDRVRRAQHDARRVEQDTAEFSASRSGTPGWRWTTTARASLGLTHLCLPAGMARAKSGDANKAGLAGIAAQGH